MHSQYIEQRKRRPLCSRDAHFVGLGRVLKTGSRRRRFRKTFRSSSARRSMGDCLLLYHRRDRPVPRRHQARVRDGRSPMSEAIPLLGEDSALRAPR